jgi:hypothetical protein
MVILVVMPYNWYTQVIISLLSLSSGYKSKPCGRRNEGWREPWAADEPMEGSGPRKSFHTAFTSKIFGS